MSDWLDDVPVDNSAMSVVKAGIKDWREKAFAVQQLEEQLKYANSKLAESVTSLSALLRKNGLEAVKLESGETLEVFTNVKCSVKKSDADKQNVADWLREQGMNELVNAALTVMPSAREKLDELGIAYDETVTMNTNSIKAYIKSEMTAGNLTQDDLPKGLSWYQYDDVRVK